MVTIEDLLAADVLTGTGGGNGVRISDRFIDAVETAEETLVDADSLRERIDTTVEDGEARRSLHSLVADDPDFVVTYLTVDRFIEAEPEEVLRATIVLAQLERGPPPDAGSPEAFMPVHADRLETVLHFFPKAVVYIWREDCDPCDLVREDFDEMFEEPPEDLGLLSVYGPADPDVLERAFGVPGGPTVLFVQRNRVLSRLYGAHHPATLQGEIDGLRDAT